MTHLEDINNRLRSDRHDFNNHLGVIYGLMDSKEYAKTMEYTSQLVNTVEDYKIIVTLPYPTIRAMLNYKLAIAKSEDITLNIDIDIPKGLTINEYDYGVILGNLIDNAIEALKNVVVEERYLVQKLDHKLEYFVIQVKNPYQDDLSLHKDLYLSTKGESDNRGYGIQNIKQLVQKHDGLISFDHNNHIFTVDIALLIEGS